MNLAAFAQDETGAAQLYKKGTLVAVQCDAWRGVHGLVSCAVVQTTDQLTGPSISRLPVLIGATDKMLPLLSSKDPEIVNAILHTYACIGQKNPDRAVGALNSLTSGDAQATLMSLIQSVTWRGVLPMGSCAHAPCPTVTRGTRPCFCYFCHKHNMYIYARTPQ